MISLFVFTFRASTAAERNEISWICDHSRRAGEVISGWQGLFGKNRHNGSNASACRGGPMAASLSCEARRIFVCVPEPRDPRCSDHAVQTESLWAGTSSGTKSGGRSVGPTAGSCRRPRHGRCAFVASGTCERPWPPCSSYDDKDSSACRLIISPLDMMTGLFTRLRGAGADESGPGLRGITR